MKDELLRALRRHLDPKFRVDVKDQFWFTRWLENVGHNAAIILGHTLYVPRTDLLGVLHDPDLEDLYWSQLYAHEGMHLAQRKDLGWFKFHWRYAFPELAAILAWLVGLVTLFVLKGLGIIEIYTLVCAAVGVSIACVVFGVNKKMKIRRTLLEIEAYATVQILRSPHWDRFFPSDVVEEIWDLLQNSWVYLGCGKSLTRSEFEDWLRIFTAVQPWLLSNCDRWRSQIVFARKNFLDKIAECE